MASESRPFSFRLEPSVEATLGRLAELKRRTKSMMLEELILEAGMKNSLIDAEDSSVVLLKLFDWIRREANISPQADYTKLVFEKIQATPTAHQLWEKAVVPHVGERPEKRRQHVNSRIGKVCKLHIGWESDEEAVLPKNAGMLIKGYTRLKPS